MKYFFLSVLMFFILVFPSCKKDFLDVPNKSVLLRQAYVTDLKSTGEYLNGIYVELSLYLYQGYNVIYGDLVADNLKPVTGTIPLINHYNWAQMADNDLRPNPTLTINMNPLWSNGYRIIGSCNFLIEEVDKYRDEDQEKADDIKGQAIAIRALIHSAIVNVFAQPYGYTANASHPGVIYKTSSKYNDPVSRYSVGEVYGKLIDDLNDAIRLLPDNPKTVTETNRRLVMSRIAAKALLARIYLYKGDYNAAKNLAAEVGRSVPIMSSANYPSKLFSGQETEALFQLPPSLNAVTGSAGNFNALYAGGYFVSPSKQYVATSDLIALFKQNTQDKRSVWVAADGSVSKYPTNILTGALARYAYYQTILRSSEMYLTAAEAYANLNNNDSARYYLDAIRKRANPSLTDITATGTALLDSVYQERRKEFAFEGTRMFDLLRWKKGVARTDATSPSAQNLVYPSNKAIAPIPTSDVDINGLDQNPDY
jgi:starch-binding outer membrane protein, SusD/RagB family